MASDSTCMTGIKINGGAVHHLENDRGAGLRGTTIRGAAPLEGRQGFAKNRDVRLEIIPLEGTTEVQLYMIPLQQKYKV